MAELEVEWFDISSLAGSVEDFLHTRNDVHPAQGGSLFDGISTGIEPKSKREVFLQAKIFIAGYLLAVGGNLSGAYVRAGVSQLAK